jgi:hypothetical protein
LGQGSVLPSHETWHSIDEVLEWFEENDVEYLSCSAPILGTDGEDARDLGGKTMSTALREVLWASARRRLLALSRFGRSPRILRRLWKGALHDPE